ncbi:HAMP domain-containing histidine kinase [Candidatus Saccharibacteria bacterium]|nr:HAMP domain-containing histidine kinase [Candidatus Saccharibacteria bacterium]
MAFDGLISDTNQQVLAGIAHELKTPLTLISGLSSELQNPQFNTDNYQQYVQRIQFSSDRLLGLVDSILRGYELEQDMLELHLEPLNPQLIMEEVANELEPHARKQAQLIAVRSRHKQTILADRGCLHAILFNLLDNAIKYSNPETTIELEARLRRGQAQLVIKDYGVGIKKNELKKLFSQFGRVQRPVPQWASSTGLGLYIARQLTEAMNGNLELSRRRDGTSFLVNLQLSRQLSIFEL